MPDIQAEVHVMMPQATDPASKMRSTSRSRPLLSGLAGCALLLLVFFVVVGVISGMDFALDQFGTYW
jgi:hypothetical protein